MNLAEKMGRPGEIIADVLPEEPEAADLLHFRSVDVKGCIFHLLKSTITSLADVEREVIILTPCRLTRHYQ